jgi:diguanylate cyclase (GGDEF)-like protein
VQELLTMRTLDDGALTRSAGPVEAGVTWLDALTGLGNRRQFDRLSREWVENASAGARQAILTIGLDRFKPINDAVGYAVGDAVLRLVAQRLRREAPENDLPIRLGGDEFIVLMTNGEEAEGLAARLVDKLSRPYLAMGHIANVGASIGIARFPEHGASASDLLRHANLALSDAKAAGGRTWRVFESAMASQAEARRALEADLRKALTLREFSVVYQPQFNIRTQTITGFEALVRWNHPLRGSVSPVLFIPIAEEIGSILALGEWVLTEACREAAQWPEPLSVAVNVSPRQLHESARLFDAVQSALRATGLPPERLELEITEGSLLSKDTHVLTALRRLRATGIRIAMDDFGTGYSSLSQLRSFPFTKIKIDRSFVSGLGTDDDAAAVVRAIAALGASLGMTTTAEGVETETQASLVAADGCTDIQGYLISKPIPAIEIDALLRRFAAATDSIVLKG